MKSHRPINLNLFTIHFPLPAIVSILHRISGVILFLLIPFLLWGLHLSLASSEGFNDLHSLMTAPLMKLIIWAILSILAYHLVAGMRHLLMDVGIGEELKTGKFGAMVALAISVLLMVLIGVWLW